MPIKEIERKHGFSYASFYKWRSRLGGIGVCGRELCCSTWLSDFKNVATSAARYQNLSLNPSKLSGQCGRLKCCLNYELETYMDALKNIPEISRPLQTEKGEASLQKTEITLANHFLGSTTRPEKFLIWLVPPAR